MRQSIGDGDTLGIAMISFAIILVLLVSLFLVLPRIVPISVANAASEPQELTIGNSTFIPLPVGFSADLPQKKLAMEAVQKFEKAHSELVVLCWNPSYIVGSMNVAVDGVFIIHRHK